MTRTTADFEILDLHHHVSAGSGPEHSGEGIGEDIDSVIARRLAFMAQHGIDRAVLLPANGYPTAIGAAATSQANDYVIAYQKREPDRFPVALGTVNPLDGKEALLEI